MRPQRQVREESQVVARPTTKVQAKRPSLPTAEELGSSTAELINRIRRWSRATVRGIGSSCRQWAAEASRGLRGLIDLESLKLGAEESRHVEKHDRPARPVRSKHVAGPVSMPAPSEPRKTRNQTRLKLVEKVAATRDHLLEVSVLESLGFFDPANEIVVSMESTPTPYPPGILPAAPVQPVPAPRAGARQLIPDIDLTSWKPHIIARSKLGKGRFSTAMIAGLLISLLTLAVVVTNLLRAPADQAARNEDTMTQASNQLGVALAGLEPVLADVTTDVAEATSTLMSVDAAARDLFDAAALLAGGTEQQVLRQSAASLAQRSLALESLIGDALSYRLVLNPLWNSPDLVGMIDPTEAASAVATWQTQLGDMTESLPTSAELEVHVGQVRGFVDGLDIWRVRYLDALSLGDLATAEAAVADLDGQLALLAQFGEEILSGLFSDAGTERGRIISDLATISG